MKRVRQELSLLRKIYAIRQHEEGRSSRDIARELGVGKTQINNIVRRKQEYLHALNQNCLGERSCRKLKKTGNEEVNKMMFDWYKLAQSKNLTVSGPILQEMARDFAKQLGITTFTASNGWLESFKKRHNISSQPVKFSPLSKIPLPTSTCTVVAHVHVMGSGSAGVNPTTCTISTMTVWKEQLSVICQGYRPDDIWTMDETALYFKALPDHTLAHKMKGCRGGKLTLSLCCSLTGEKEKPILIGKTYRPRCFKNLDVDELPVTWRSNESAQMTSATFEDWLTKLNSRMKHQKRNILLFLDDETCHPPLSLSNIKLQFFPHDMTLELQPLDQGVIKSVKARYRKRLLQHFVSLTESSISAAEVTHKLTVLDAAYWIAKAWDKTSPTTIQKCFKACGFSNTVFQERTHSKSSDPQASKAGVAITGPDEETEALLMQIGQHEVANWQQILGIDDNAPKPGTAEGNLEARLLTSIQDDTAGDGEGSEDIEDEEDADPDTTQEISLGQMLQTLTDQKAYAIQKGDMHMLNSVMNFRDYVVGNYVESRPQKQTIITHLFPPSRADI